MSGYRLTHRADGDVIDLFLYGIEQFGLRQARAYRDGLERCFGRLAENPFIGRPAPSIAEGVRRYEFKSHVVLYQIDGADILVLAIVHGRNVRRLTI